MLLVAVYGTYLLYKAASVLLCMGWRSEGESERWLVVRFELFPSGLRGLVSGYRKGTCSRLQNHWHENFGILGGHSGREGAAKWAKIFSKSAVHQQRTLLRGPNKQGINGII